MKKYSFLFILSVICTFSGCEDVDNRPAGGTWNIEPLKEYSVTPKNGGATITYSIDKNPDILYIMAEFERNGQIFTEKSSVHTNMLELEGFHRVNKVKTKLYKVNRKEERSQPLEIEFEPLESIIDLAFKSWDVIPSFGGVTASWENPQQTELGIRLMTADKENPNEMETRELYFSSTETERYSFRGFDAVETKFGVTFEDKWGNISDTIIFTTTPFFETMIPKPYADFRASIPYDNITSLSGRNISVLWDNTVNTASHGWLTNPGGSGLSITIDMKQVAKLSRIVMHPYHVNSAYGQANITTMEAWGISKIDYDKLQDREYWLDSLSVARGAILGVDPTHQLPLKTFKDDWEYLGWHTIPIYTTTEEIVALSQNGAQYETPIEAKPVRYVRIFVREISRATPPANNYFSSSEITFYGDNTVPQE